MKVEARTLGAVHTHTHTHTGSLEACLECDKKEYIDIKTHELCGVFKLALASLMRRDNLCT